MRTNLLFKFCVNHDLFVSRQLQLCYLTAIAVLTCVARCYVRESVSLSVYLLVLQKQFMRDNTTRTLNELSRITYKVSCDSEWELRNTKNLIYQSLQTIKWGLLIGEREVSRWDLNIFCMCKCMVLTESLEFLTEFIFAKGSNWNRLSELTQCFQRTIMQTDFA